MTAAEDAYDQLMLTLLVERHTGMPRWRPTTLTGEASAPRVVNGHVPADPNGQRHQETLLAALNGDEAKPRHLKRVA